MSNITRSRLAQHNDNNQRAIFAVFGLWGLPPTLLDVGSGAGAMTDTARALGVDAIGLDLLAQPPDIKHDLNKTINLNKQFDMVLSIETAEHIKNAKSITQTICTHLKPGGVLVFTAALPGQKGNGHVNCQNHAYWRDQFYPYGLRYDNSLTALLALMWSQMTGGLSAWLVPNLQVFLK